MSITKIKASNITEGSITASKLANTYALSTDSISAGTYANTAIANASSASLYANTGINNAASASLYANTGINNAASASAYANTAITDDTTTETTHYPLLSIASSGTLLSANTSSSKLTYIPNTGTLSSTQLSSANVSYTGTLTGGAGVVALGTNQLYKDAAGNVGIGTSSPGAKLDVTGSQYIRHNSYDALTINGSSTNSVGLRIQNTVASGRNWNIVISGGASSVGTTGAFSIWDDTAAVSRLVIDPSGNVGIGTSSPGYLLNVSKNGSGGDLAQLARFTDTNTSNSLGPFHLTIGVANHYAFSPSPVLCGTNGIALGVGDGSNLDTQRRLIIDVSGNVGIGTSSPDVRLHVTAPNPTQGILAHLTNSTATTGAYLQITNAGIADWGIGQPAGATPALSFRYGTNITTAGTEYMRIDSSGKVGINVTPAAGTNAKLQITGLATNATTLATAYSDASLVVVPKSTSGYSLAIASGTGDSPQLQVSANGAASGDLLIQPYGGNVGIGGTNHGNKLALHGGIRFLANEAAATTYTGIGSLAADTVSISTSGSERMRIDTSGNVWIVPGNVGIGTTNPAYKLDIQSNAAGQFWASIKNTNAGASSIGGWIFGNDTYSDVGGVFAGSSGGGGFGGANSMNIGSWKSAPLAMFTNNTERMRIDESGRVTMPYQPRFMAIRTVNQTGYTGGTVVIFNHATINVGNHYNTTTGLFTAPVAGNYIFEVGIYMSAAVVQIWPLVNGGRVESIVVTSLADTNLTATTVRYLNANDTYCLVPYAGHAAGLTIYENGYHTYFRGTLIG